LPPRERQSRIAETRHGIVWNRRSSLPLDLPCLDRDSETRHYFAIAALLAVVFVVDHYTRLGLAEWILYMVPVGLCVFVGRTSAPIIVAALASVLIVLGFLVSGTGVNPQLGVLNRWSRPRAGRRSTSESKASRASSSMAALPFPVPRIRRCSCARDARCGPD
jgi:hypothetical protein